MTEIEGRLERGLGEAAQFTRLDWVRRQLVELAGIDPHPGTVNLVLPDESMRARWRRWRELPAEIVEPADAAFCRARCYPARIARRLPAAIVVPEVDSYPQDKIELVAAVAVRAHLALDDGGRVAVELCRPIAAEAVLFDIDGTLVDSIGAYHEVARLAAEPFGLEITERHVRESLAGGSSFWKGVVPENRADREELAKTLSAHAGREWPRVLREYARVFDGLAQTLDAIKAMGIALGIVSGARPEVLELMREQGIVDRFDAIVLGGDVSRRKPHPEGILTCLARLGVAPEAAIYVGDTPVDIAASRAAGVHSVGVLTGAGDSASLSAHEPDRLIFSHSRLPAIVTVG